MAPFVTYPHPALAIAATVRPVDAAMLAAGEQLLAAARAVQAYGLAAAHLGLNEPLVVISIAEVSNNRDYRILYNPQVAELAHDMVTGSEGSVSMPGIEVPIARSAWVLIDYDDAQGMRQDKRLEGFAARVVQHEVDQMNGVFFLDRLSRIKRDMALRKFAKGR